MSTALDFKKNLEEVVQPPIGPSTEKMNVALPAVGQQNNNNNVVGVAAGAGFDSSRALNVGMSLTDNQAQMRFPGQESDLGMAGRQISKTIGEATNALFGDALRSKADDGPDVSQDPQAPQPVVAVAPRQPMALGL